MCRQDLIVTAENAEAGLDSDAPLPCPAIAANHGPGIADAKNLP